MINTKDLTPQQQRYLEICQFGRDLAPRSIESYASALRCFNRFFVTQEKPAEMSVDLILRYIEHMKLTRGLGKKAIHTQVSVLKGYSLWLYSNGCIDRWPFANGEIRIKLPTQRPRPLKRAQITKFLEQTVSPAEWLQAHNEISLPRAALVAQRVTMNLSIRMLLATGMRIGELTNIKLENMRESGAHIRILGKGLLERNVFITNSELLDDIQLYLAGRTSMSFDHHYFLLNQYGRRLRYWTLGKTIQRMRAEIGDTDGVLAHRIRHSTASYMFERGAELLTIQRLLGHAKITTTQVYTQVSDDRVKRTLLETDPLDFASS